MVVSHSCAYMRGTFMRVNPTTTLKLVGVLIASLENGDFQVLGLTASLVSYSFEVLIVMEVVNVYPMNVFHHLEGTCFS